MRKVALASVPMSVMMTVTSFAQETGTANADVVTAVTTMANDMKATGNAIIPIALTVVGLTLVVTFGLRIFKKIAK